MRPSAWRYLALLLPLLAAGCQTQLPSVSELQGRLTGGSSRTWIFLELTRGGSLVSPAPCEQDDRYTFRQDSTYTLDNPIPCAPGESTRITGRWRFDAGGREFVLLVDGSGAEVRFLLKELSDTRLSLTFPDPFNPEFFLDRVFTRLI